MTQTPDAYLTVDGITQTERMWRHVLTILPADSPKARRIQTALDAAANHPAA